MSKVKIKQEIVNAIIAVIKGTIVASESLGTGDGSVVTFGATTANQPVVPGSVTATDASVSETFTDNADGTLTGNLGGVGTVNYVTGVVSVTFATAPANLDAVTMGYRHGNAGFGVVNRNKEQFGGGHLEFECVGAPDGRKTQIVLNIQEFAKPMGDVGGIR